MVHEILPVTSLQSQFQETENHVSFTTTALWYIGRAVMLIKDANERIANLFSGAMRHMHNYIEEAKDSLLFALHNALIELEKSVIHAYKVLSGYRSPPKDKVIDPLFPNYSVEELLTASTEKVAKVFDQTFSIPLSLYEELRKQKAKSATSVPTKHFGTGINNPDTTCYIASVLQGLRFIPKFRSNLCDQRLEKNELVQQLKQIYNTIDEQGRAVSTAEINRFRNTALHYGWDSKIEKGGEKFQQDAAAFCLFLLEQLGYASFAFNTVVDIDNYDKLNMPVGSLKVRGGAEEVKQISLPIGEEIGNGQSKNLKGTPRELSQIVLKNRILEEVEGVIAKKLTANTHLPNPLGALTKKDDNKHISTLQTVEMDQNNIPHILPIVLQRYGFDNNIRHKIETEVHPSDIIDFPINGDYPNKRARYRFVSLIQHEEHNSKSGHYFTCVPHQISEDGMNKQIFVEFNDGKTAAHLDAQKIQSVIAEKGYLFFYEYDDIVEV